MKILLSPAKTFAKELTLANDMPYFFSEANHLINRLKQTPKSVIQNKMKLSDDLLKDVLSYLDSFGIKAYKAIYTYQGQAYKSFDVKSLDEKSLSFMQDHLLILSGLYGILKPYDGISFYRLEMQDQTVENLYSFWQAKLNHYFNTFCKDEMIISLLSDEYSKALPKELPVYSIDFIMIQDNKIQKKSMELKTMRGRFARYLIEHKIKELNELNKIVLDDYTYDKDLSSPYKIIFSKEVKHK
jgi:cytoplasmic iron level regulating protein YaaA (DUF328/UPF0246 family)